jgi:hypothetical protein
VFGAEIIHDMAVLFQRSGETEQVSFTAPLGVEVFIDEQDTHGVDPKGENSSIVPVGGEANRHRPNSPKTPGEQRN